MSDPTRRQIMQMADEVGITDYAAAARLVRLALAVFRPTPTPVPVSEGLPGDQLSWWYEPDEWLQGQGGWNLLRIRGGTGTFTHWLPAHALPLPSGEVE